MAITLFPAHAGVIPVHRSPLLIRSPFPRACGGDPWFSPFWYSETTFSPRMRG